MNKQIKIYTILHCFTLFLIVSSKSFCSFEHLAPCARYIAMGNTGVGSVDTPTAVYLNPAGLEIDHTLCFSAYFSHPFGINGISSGAAVMKASSKWGSFGLGYKSFGNNLYSEKVLSFSYGDRILDHFMCGITMNFMRLDIKNYGYDTQINFDIGIITRITGAIRYGFYASNLNRARIGARAESIPQVFVTGISYQPQENLLINFDLYKDILFPGELRFGTEYHPFKLVNLRVGFQTYLKKVTAGFGIIMNRTHLHYSFETHPYLRLTHHFSITFNLN